MPIFSSRPSIPLTITRADFQGRVALVKRMLERTSAVWKLQICLTEEEAKGKLANFVGAVQVRLGLGGSIEFCGQYSARKF